MTRLTVSWRSDAGRRLAGRRLSGALRLVAVACVVALSTGPNHVAGSSVSAGTSGPAEGGARVAVRAGDAAPGVARFTGLFAQRLAATRSGGVLFVDSRGTALFLEAGGEVRTLAYAGQEIPGAGRLAMIFESAAGDDGTIAFRASLADGRDGVFRIAPGADLAAPALLAGTLVPLEGGEAVASSLSGPAVGGSGTVIVSVDCTNGVGTIVAIPPAGGPESLIETGDPLAFDRFVRSPVAPAANGSDLVVFAAALASGGAAVASIVPGGAPQILFNRLPGADGIPPAVDLAAPVLNNAGQVAFLWADHGVPRLQGVDAGLSRTLAAPGQPIQGGDSLAEVTDLQPAIDEAGHVDFGGVLQSGAAGLFRAGAGLIALVASPGAILLDGSVVTGVDIRQPDPGPAPAADGSLWFAGRVTGIDGRSRAGLIAGPPFSARVLSGDPVPTPPRFASFLESAIPHLAGGPALGSGGVMLFDARVTGGARGLFLRDSGGALSSVALDGDEAPGGGRFDGEQFAFHSVAGDAVAFLGAAQADPPVADADAGSAPGRAVYAGRPGSGLRRILGVGDADPAGPQVVTDLQPPSRVNHSGAIAIPAALSDGTTALYGFSSGALFRIAGTSDPLPGGASLTRIFTGSNFLNVALPPALDDAGMVAFGATTSSGDAALFTAPLRPDGASAARRVLGAGDAVEGGRLFPFELQALDRDAEGGVAFSAIFDDNSFQFGTFSLEGGGPPVAIARPFDFLAGLDFVFSVSPALALAGGGSLAYGVHFFGGSDAILLREPSGSPGGDPVVTLLALTEGSAPDGGHYTALQAGARATSRIASDGKGLLAFAAATDAGPEEIILSGQSSNTPPVAATGPDRIVECAGPSGTGVELDGSGSSDPDGDPLTYRWSGPFGEVEGERPLVLLPLGVSTVTLIVSDGASDSEPAAMRVTVQDTEPPILVAAAQPASLWPPDGRMVEVSVGVTLADRCDAHPALVLSSVQVQDGTGGRPGPSVAGVETGTDDRTMELRAARAGSGPGCSYDLIYQATDASGNTSLATAVVTVAHDQRRPAGRGR
jgi:hypothetical protein